MRYRVIAPFALALAAACGSPERQSLLGPPALVVTPSQLTWTVVDLGPQPLFEFGFYPQGISNKGHQVGQGRIGGITQGGLVTPTGAWVHLRPLPGDSLSNAIGVNSAGRAVGLSSTDPRYRTTIPVVWSPGGVAEAIPGLSRMGNSSYAEAINDAGVVVGYGLITAASTADGFVWVPGRPLQRLQTPPGYSPVAAPVGISDRGVIIGAMRPLLGGAHLVLWGLDGKATPIGAPPGYSEARPTAINNAGMVVGWGFDGFSYRPWVWTAARGFQVLPLPAGYSGAWARGVDQRGRVYGHTVFGAGVPLIWEEGSVRVIPSQGTGRTSGALVSRTGIMAGGDLVAGVEHHTLWFPNVR